MSKDFLNFFGSFFPGVDLGKFLAISEIVGRVEGSFKQGLLEGGFSEDQAVAIVISLNTTLIKAMSEIALSPIFQQRNQPPPPS